MTRVMAGPRGAGGPARRSAAAVGWTVEAHSAAPARWAASAVVFAGLLFNAVLCAAATRGLHVSRALIAGTEVGIVAAALLVAWREAMAHLLIPGVLIALCVTGLWLADPVNDPKIAVELAIIGGFACLGLSVGDPRVADRLVWVAAVLVLVVGLWEMFALPSFEHTFDILGYFIDKGTLSADQIGDTGTRLSENGVRPAGDGRQLLPGLLGLHRVGSVFLEPISAGDFAVVCVAWALARPPLRLRGGLLITVALAIGVLADARFAVVSSVAVAGVVLSGAWRSRVLVAAMPFAMLALLLVIGLNTTAQVDNSIGGRLIGSGRLLEHWSAAEWLGLSQPGGVSMDTGYSYVMGNLGALGAIALWLVVALRPKPPQAARLFAAIAVYFTLGLSTGYSCLSIKTAALLWFAYGTLLAGTLVNAAADAGRSGPVRA